jgi:glycosyltransferase involved in cell wall biosynthesis
MVRILNINSRDLSGQAFNNFEIADSFKNHGIVHSFLVDHKESNNDAVQQMYTNKLIQRINLGLNIYTGQQNRLNFWSGMQFNSVDKQSVDLLHFHLIENGWFHIPTAFKWMNRMPSVWTFHDLWPITGHCIQPLGCQKWENECRKCPDLKRPFQVKIDRTRQQFRYKIKQLENTNLQIHVSTKWSLKQIARISNNLAERATVIPFGLTIPEQVISENQLRTELGISPLDKVVFVRGTPGNYKNMDSLRIALKDLKEITRELVLIDVDSAGFFSDLGFKKYIQFSWIERSRLIDLIRLSDAVIVPSSAETFGVLVVEAQLCGKPVLVQANTACEEVAGGRETSFSFSGSNLQSQVTNFLTAILLGENEISEIAHRGRLRAEIEYSPNLYVERMSDLYNLTINQHKFTAYR